MSNKNIKVGAVITYVQLFLNIIISILCTPIIIRILGPGEHGIYATVSSAISFLSLLSLGIGSSYIRYYAKYKSLDERDKIYRLNGVFLLMFLVIGAVALAAGLLLTANVEWIFGSSLTASEYVIARRLALIVTLDLALSFPASVFNSIIRSNERYIWVKSVNMVQSVLSPVLTVPMLLLGFGSVGMVLITTVIDIIAYLLNIVFCFVRLKSKFIFGSPEKNILRSIFGFSIFIAINSVINQVNTSLDKVLLARLVDTASVSVYAIGFSLYTYYSGFSTAITSLFTPRVHSMVRENEEDPDKMGIELTDIFVKLGRLQFMIQMLMLTGIIFFGKPFIKFWAGPDYGNSYYVALILCCAYTIPLCQNIGTEIQRAQNKHQLRTIVYAIMTFANIILTVILCQLWGEIGAVIGTAIAVIAIEVIFMNIYYHKKLHINVFKYWLNMLSMSKGLIIPIAVGALIMAFVAIDSYFDLILLIGIYSVIYIVSVCFLAMNNFEKDLVFGKIREFLKRRKTNIT